MSSNLKGGRVITYAQAVYEATVQEMERDPNVFVYGIGADDPKGVYGTTMDLHKKFGANRNFDTPLSEDAMTGLGIGAALAGMRPIHVHQRVDFLMLCMNQLINVAAKSSYMFGGQVKVPLTVRAIIGRSWGQGAQHSQALHSFFMHVPGIKVAVPTTPHDAKGCMIASIRDNNPVIFFEHRMLYNFHGIVPEGSYEVPFSKARLLAEGDDITIVGISHMVVESLRARRQLQSERIGADVIDPVTLTPIDMDTIAMSVEKTGRLLVVDNAWTSCGASAEIVAQTIEWFQDVKEIKVKRLGFAPVPCPTTKSLEDLFYPNSNTIASAAFALVKGDHKTWVPELEVAKEVAEFRGPF